MSIEELLKKQEEIINRDYKTDKEAEKYANDLAQIDEEIALFSENKKGEEESDQKIVYTTGHTVKEMKQEAKLRGIKGYSRMKEAQLIKVLNA